MQYKSFAKLAGVQCPGNNDGAGADRAGPGSSAQRQFMLCAHPELNICRTIGMTGRLME